jgi:localization factor PodJL
MTFGVLRSEKRARPEARKVTKEAARQSGMPLGDWFNSVIFRQTHPDNADPRARGADPMHGDELASVNQRLDDLTRRIEQITRSGPAAYAPRRVRNDAQPPEPQAPPLAPAQPPHIQLPPGLDRAVAEVAARRRALNGEAAQPGAPAPMPAAAQMPAPMPMPIGGPPLAAAPQAPPAPMQTPLPTQDLSGLEHQLRRITDQIETLRTPGIEDAITALREELIQIGHVLTEALPRNAIESLEKQILELAIRIDEGRAAGIDQRTLAGIEQGLAEVRNALHGLTPAENLVGFNEAVAGLAQKIDFIVAEKDPATLHQLESAITTLREMAEHIATNEAVTQVANEVLALGEKVDYIARASAGSDALNNLDYRVAAIADALAQRAQGGDSVAPRLEALVQSLSDKIERIQSVPPESGALGNLESRIAHLVEKLDASESRLGHLQAIERGLGDLLAHIEELHTTKTADALRAGAAPAVDDLKQNMARTQDALEAVHGTLGHVVDRLAMIEKEFRSEARPRPSAEDAPAAPVGRLAVRAIPVQPAPIPSPANLAHLPPQAAPEHPAAPLQPALPQAIQPEQPQAAPRRRVASSLPISGDSTVDEPLEPGSGPPKFSARIAASEAALGGVGPAATAPAGKSSFIAAARRAAQAAMQQGQGAPAQRLETEETAKVSLRSRLMKRMKSVFIAASIIAVVIGGFQIAGNVLHLGNETDKPGNPGQLPAATPNGPSGDSGTLP